MEEIQQSNLRQTTSKNERCPNTDICRTDKPQEGRTHHGPNRPSCGVAVGETVMPHFLRDESLSLWSFVGEEPV